MKIKKLLICLVLLIQIIALLFSPRFGWKIHYTDSSILNYVSSFRKNGKTHSLYGSEVDTIIISYKNRFSRKLLVQINNTEEHIMNTNLDGESIETYNHLPYTSNDLVWQDSSGIFYRVYIFSYIAVYIGILMLYYAAKKEQEYMLIHKIIGIVSLIVSLLISFRIII